MKILKCISTFLLTIAVAVPSIVNAETCLTTSSRDSEALQGVVNAKRTNSLDEKNQNLSISGDVRAKWAHIDERIADNRLRGENGLAYQIGDGSQPVGSDNPRPDEAETYPGFSKNKFGVEYNLYIDYSAPKTWGVVWLQFDNEAGIARLNKSCAEAPAGLFGNGCFSDLSLKKAYFGYNVFTDGCQRFDIEVGRRPMYSAFDSRMQFQSNFDGLLFKYKRDLSEYGLGDGYWNIGTFVVDERADTYAYVSEMGLKNIMDLGVDVKYSFTDWKSLMIHSKNRCREVDPLGHEFRVHQLSSSYTVDAPYICMPVKLYGALLWNSSAKKSSTVPDSKENIGGYIGVLTGEVCKEGDWSVDLMYQYAPAQVVPGRDFCGIGSNGNNLLGDYLYTSKKRDYTNIQGVKAEAIYAITSSLTVDMCVEFGREISSKVGGKHSYSKVEVQGIYAF